MHLTGSGMNLKLLGDVTWKFSKHHNIMSIQIICINIYKSITQQQHVFYDARHLSQNSKFEFTILFPPYKFQD